MSFFDRLFGKRSKEKASNPNEKANAGESNDSKTSVGAQTLGDQSVSASIAEEPSAPNAAPAQEPAKEKKAKPDPLEGLRGRLDAIMVPAIGLVVDDGFPFGRLGGCPLAPADFVWPTFQENPLS